MAMRILMLGPGEAVVGGISTVTETIVPVLKQHVDLLYFFTVRHRSVKKSGKVSPQNIAFAISQYARFLSALYRFRPHIIHLHTSQDIGWLKDTFFVPVGKAYHCSVVLHVHAADFDGLYGKKSGPIQHYTRTVMGLADAVIALSEEWANRLTNIVPAERIFTFKNCIAVDAFLPQPPYRPKDKPRALFLGTVGARKGAFDLLEAMGRLKSRGSPLQAWIAGDEERKGQLHIARARLKESQLGHSCQLLGIVRGKEKAELLSKASFFVLPSYNEGLPMAVLEAMAAGLAVVSTPVGGIPEVVKDGYNGFLVTPGDVTVLAEKLAVLASDPHLCKVMGQRSREIAERELDVKPYVERLVAVYDSLVKPRRKKTRLLEMTALPPARLRMNDRDQT